MRGMRERCNWEFDLVEVSSGWAAWDPPSLTIWVLAGLALAVYQPHTQTLIRCSSSTGGLAMPIFGPTKLPILPRTIR